MNAEEIHGKLEQDFGDAISGFQAELIDPAIDVAPEKLREVALTLRDDPELAMSYLRLLTGVDRGDALEVVYHLYSYDRRHGIALRVRVDRDEAVAPTVSDIWRSAEWYEREAYDLLGIRFADHPDLRRIMMPHDWEGHPLRKDYVFPESYHGITAARGDGLEAAPGADPPPPPAERDYEHAWHEPLAEPMEGMLQLNMGPHHPSTHGVLRLLLHTDGEILSRAIPDVGYLHRGMEKIAESIPYPANMPYTDRVDYLAAMTCNQAWAIAAEQILGIEVPERAEYCRVIAAELNRIASHLVGTGAMAMDLGAFTPFIHWVRERETVNDITERICGARLTYNYMRIGGVSRDIDQETVDKTLAWLDHFVPIIDEFDNLISNNEIFVQRLANVAVISPEDAVSYGLVGPNLRASGVDWDLRRDEPYSVYPELEFDVITGKAWRGAIGDCYDRFYCRVEEMRQSARIVRQACEKLPEGEILGKVPKKLKPKANETYAAVESARGELGCYVISDGSDKPYRARYRTGSFSAMSIIDHLSPGLMVADLVALVGALDVVAPEVDR